MARFDRGLRQTFVNAAAARHQGHAPGECVGRTLAESGVPADAVERCEERLRHVFATGEPVAFAATDGSRLFEVQMEPEPDGRGGVASVLSVARDVTAAQRTTDALRESELLHAQAEAIAHMGSWTWDAGTGAIAWSDELYRIHGYEPGDIRAAPDMVEAHLLPQDLVRIDAARRRALEHGEPWQMEVRIRGADGAIRVLESRGRPRHDPAGRIVGLEGSAQDVTDRRRAEQALRESEERFRLVARATNEVVYDWNIVTGDIWWSEALASVMGYEADATGRDITWWESHLHPDDHGRVVEALGRAISEGRPWSAEYRFRRSDGSWATVLERGFAILDDEGRPTRMIGSMADISEREALAAQIRHAQKMDAVDRLAGGIAHDFNNVLTAILTTAELAIAELEPAHPVHADLREIQAAGARAATLTRQLLAFSRRQVLQPQLLDPNELVAGAHALLRRLLGAQIGLEVVPEPDVGLVRADCGQLEQLLVNLAVNARDAMPEGGTLSIRVGRHEESTNPGGAVAGPWVTIAVRDTGIGMDEATLARAFEPFFTTKPVGEGTGLGLAMVYGIAQQSGGFVRAESVPGAGTTVTLYLPERPRSAPSGPPPVPAALPRLEDGGASGTILLAEDEAAVRRATRRMLERAGYRVLEAEDGEAALELYQRHPDAVRLVLSDIVMPRMGGVQLAERLREYGADVPVLFMSGYDEQQEGAGRAGGPRVLPKPFGQVELLVAVRTAVGG